MATLPLERLPERDIFLSIYRQPRIVGTWPSLSVQEIEHRQAARWGEV
jgi:hypothetical protein